MRESIKNFMVVLVCVLVVVSALFVYSNSTRGDNAADQSNSEETTHTTVEETPQEDNSEMITPQGQKEEFTPTPSENPGETDSVTPANQGQMYDIGDNNGRFIGNKGILPSTSVAVITKRSRGTVSFETCTVAFSLPGKSGKPWAITAGHCGKVGQKVYTVPTGNNFSTAHFLGVVRYASAFGSKKYSGDWAGIRLDPSAVKPQVSTKIPRVLDTYPRKKGDTLCKRGKTTGFNCGAKGEDGVKTYLSRSVDDNKEVVANMSQVYLCALPGDSGSPVYDKNGIIGVLSSTSASENEIKAKKCYTKNIGYYTPIDEVLGGIKKNVPDIIVR